MSVQTDTMDADSVGQCVLTVKEAASRFSGRDEEFYPWDVSALNIIDSASHRVWMDCSAEN